MVSPITSKGGNSTRSSAGGTWLPERIFMAAIPKNIGYTLLKMDSLTVPLLSANVPCSTPMVRRILRWMFDIRVSQLFHKPPCRMAMPAPPAIKVGRLRGLCVVLAPLPSRGYGERSLDVSTAGRRKGSRRCTKPTGGNTWWSRGRSGSSPAAGRGRGRVIRIRPRDRSFRRGTSLSRCRRRSEWKAVRGSA